MCSNSNIYNIVWDNLIKYVISTSLGGRLVLFKYVISYFLIYYLSFFKAFTYITPSIKSHLNFCVCGGDHNMKILWVKWDDICLSKESGGLEVRSMREFSLALLGKWCWMMVVNKSSLWDKVLGARWVWWSFEGGRVGLMASIGGDLSWLCDGCWKLIWW